MSEPTIHTNDTLQVAAADTLGGTLPAGWSADSLGVADSLRMTDSLRGADSVQVVLPPPVIDTVEAVDVFGAASERTFVSVPPRRDAEAWAPIHQTGYQLAVVGLLLLFVFVLFRMRTEWLRMLRLAWRREDEEHDDEADMPSAGVLAAEVVCGCWMLGVAALRFGEVASGEGFRLVAESAWAVVAGVALLALAIVSLQQLLIGAIASLTFSQRWRHSLSLRRQAWFASFVLTGTPCVLLAALAGDGWAGVLAVCFAVVAALHAVGYAVRSCVLFAKLKVSILLWILYLCAVEIMPVGILAVGLLRSWPA